MILTIDIKTTMRKNTIFRRFKKAFKNKNTAVLENLSKTHLFELRLYVTNGLFKIIRVKYSPVSGAFIAVDV
ncbi:MAG: hypothetical protein PHI79_05740 [Sulfurovaceae bacterium]|nr:hypothetical protein [Sulfurovaceae bacterium]MDD5549079.1 hypothetical protein [Sulfurovaceae bacterium]